MNKNENVVVALFSSLAEAEAAVARLQKWDKNVKDVKLGAIGQVTNVDGRIKTHLINGGIFNRSFPLSDEAVNALGNELAEGRVAIVVASDDYEVSLVKQNLESAGGRIVSAHYERTADELKDEQKAIDAIDDKKAYDKGVDRSLDVAAINKSGFN